MKYIGKGLTGHSQCRAISYCVLWIRKLHLAGVDSSITALHLIQLQNALPICYVGGYNDPRAQATRELYRAVMKPVDRYDKLARRLWSESAFCSPESSGYYVTYTEVHTYSY